MLEGEVHVEQSVANHHCQQGGVFSQIDAEGVGRPPPDRLNQVVRCAEFGKKGSAPSAKGLASPVSVWQEGSESGHEPLSGGQVTARSQPEKVVVREKIVSLGKIMTKKGECVCLIIVGDNNARSFKAPVDLVPLEPERETLNVRQHLNGTSL